ncbi:alpha/beta fold hydrolase [Clostridium sp. CF012]|uniref:alpha/beta fold hydrolase n=1 Tax=Clostridium sp. CF012 TaxID=2843319 RepID=UPI001C0CB71F|nr:alpha/beta hydrolase [Clostridium sp. CF012]MBU3143804.1 alpha/beta hydrolase [Clostridium sp. CF012]
MEKTKIYRNIAKLKNIDMFYFDTKAEGPTILCLHGRWGRAETWYDFINHYGKQYRIIAPDKRGHGLSSKPLAEYTTEEMAEDIIELLNFLKIDSVILVGHSMGGAVAGYLAAVYPKYVNALAILDKSAAEPAELNDLPLDKSQLSDPLTKDWPLPFATLNAAMNFIKQATDSNLEYQYFMNSLVETVEGYQMMFSPKAMAIGIAHNKEWYNLLPNIKCLVLLIKSKGNEVIPDEDFIKMQSLLPNCIAREMSHPDHNIHLKNIEEFYKYFDEFLTY